MQPTSEQASVDWTISYHVLFCLKELAKHSIGKSLILCGQYPYAADEAMPIDLEGMLNLMLTGLCVPNFKNFMVWMII